MTHRTITLTNGSGAAMSRLGYEIWLGEGRGTLLASSFERSKAILRRHFKGPVYLSDEYRTDRGIGWTAYESARERADDPWGWSAAKLPSIERLACRLRR